MIAWLVIAIVVLLALLAGAGLGAHARDLRALAAARARLAAASRPGAVFTPEAVSALPEPIARYFRFAIAEGARLYATTELEMHGEIGLGTRAAPGYRPFTASQIMGADGFVWQVRAGGGVMRLAGSDGLVGDDAWTRFWLFGLVPIVRAGGTTDYARSAFGRLVAEAVFWAPASLLPRPGVDWRAVSDDTIEVEVDRAGFRQQARIAIGDDGRPLSVVIPRWSNANPARRWQFQPFGGYGSDFGEFQGYRPVRRLEGGNFFGTEDYFPFYKAEVDSIRLS